MHCPRSCLVAKGVPAVVGQVGQLLAQVSVCSHALESSLIGLVSRYHWPQLSAAAAAAADVTAATASQR